jgi:ankyrin repeat protein
MSNPPPRPQKRKREDDQENQDPNKQLVDVINFGNKNRQQYINNQIEHLIDQGANVNGVNPEYRPLHLAIENDLTEVVSFLLDKGADINVINHDGDTPIIHSLEHSMINCFDMFLRRGANCRLSNGLGQTVLMCYAAKLWHKLSPLFIGGENRILRDFNRMIQLGANINATESTGRTTLHIACAQNIINENTIFFIQTLLENGANVNIRDQIGDSPILLIYNRDMIPEQFPLCINVAKILIYKGADVNVIDNQNHGLLQHACAQLRINNGDVFELIKTLFYMPDPNDPMRLDVNEQVVATMSQLLQQNGHGEIIEDVIQYIKKMTQMRSVGVSQVLQEGIGYYDPDVTRYLYKFMDKKLGGKKKTARRKNKKRKTRRRK